MIFLLPLAARAAAALALLTTALSATPALAAGTQSLSIGATLQGVCTIAKTQDMIFAPTVTGLGYSLADAEGKFSVTCTTGMTPSTSLSTPNRVGGCGQTRMSKNGSGGPYINYDSYSDPGRGGYYNATGCGANSLSTTTGSAQSYSIYGRMPAGSASEAGTYSDTLTITLNF